MGNTIRCKFKCQSVTQRWNDYEKRTLYDYVFQAVTSGSEENKQFFAYTPSGTLNVGSVTCDQFKIGEEYYLDISEAPIAVKA